MTMKSPRALLQVLLVLQLQLQKWQVLPMNIPRNSPIGAPSCPSLRQLRQLGWYHFPRYRMDRVWGQIHFLSYQSSFGPFLYQAPFRHFIVWLKQILERMNDLLWCGYRNQKLFGKNRRVLPWFQAALVARVPVRFTSYLQLTMAY